MFQNGKTTVLMTCCAGCLLAYFDARTAVAGDQAAYQKLIEEKGPSLVTVKFLLKMKMGGFGDQENETEITGVMIDAKGLVLCSNTQISGFTSMMRRMMGRMGGDMTATPTDIKVLVGDDTEGLEASLTARDSDLDLAWVQIKEPGERTFAFIDFSKGASIKIGQSMTCLRRMGKYFDRVPAISEGRISGITTKPRDLFLPSADLSGGLGAPVFTLDGQIVGLLILQIPDADDSGGNSMAMMSQMSGLQDAMAGLILPAADVLKATQRAKESGQSENTAKTPTDPSVKEGSE